MSLVRFDSITKSFGGKPVLEGVSLRIEEGEKIGLIGRNGVGKTTIFRLITGELEPDGGVIERMRRARVASLAQMRNTEAASCRPAADVGGTAGAPHGRTIFDAVMATFHDLIEMEHTLNRLGEELGAGNDSLLKRYSALQHEFASRGGYEFRTTVKRVLHGLGFKVEDFDLPLTALSGGQRTRLMLALVLLQDADLLLLDEPENHLDIEAQEWLEEFLLACPKAIVAISHDRRMLNTVASRILDLERGKLVSYTGNYDEYMRQKNILRGQQQRAFDQQQEFIEKEQRWIDRFRYKNTKASQVQSRIKRLEKLERLDAPPPDGSAAKFAFGEVVRSGQWVIEARDLGMAYGDLTLYKGLSFEATRGERVGIIGPNGSGKTTLLRHLAGKLNSESGASGIVTIGHKVTLGFYEQHHEALFEGLNKTNDILTEIRIYRPDMTPEKVRTFMGRFLFVGDDVFKPLSALSGGELSRVAIAKLILSGANVLLLDEPTNHLDIASRETIEAALEAFPGTILIVSHDRQLIDRFADKLVVIENGAATIHLGNYTHYRWKQQAQGAPGTGTGPFPSGQGGRSTADVLRIREKKPVRGKSEFRRQENESRKKRKQVEDLERNIESVEEMVQKLEAQFPALDPADYAKVSALNEEYDSLKEDLKGMYAEWERLAGE
jgi:ATP-binding cassette subfamily F protein 3